MNGREAERRRGLGLLDGAPLTSARLEMVGEAGIGKSALFDLVVAEARARGFTILQARPSQAETPLAFAVLGDLLREISDLGSLPPPQARALEVALGRRSDDGAPTSTQALGAGLAALFSGLAAQGLTLLAIDDLQWIDAASADVLSFALRRLPATNMVALVARRPDGPAQFAADEQLELSALPAEIIERVAREHATNAISSTVLERVVQTAGGNPLFAIELVRNLSAGTVQPLVPMPVPAMLTQLVAGRIAALPTETVEVLAAASLLAAPTIERVAELGMLDDLAPAEVAGVVQIVGRQVRFAHPLLASAAHDAIPGTRRLRLHRQLAEVTSGLERCVHLALGTDRRDGPVADELAVAVPGLLDRGAVAEAADLAVLSLSITPVGAPDLCERMLMCADALFRAGRTEEALAQLASARRDAPTNDLAARALLGLATIEYSHTDNAEDAAVLARQALELTADPALLAEAHTIMSRVIYTDFDAAADHAAEALRLMETLRTDDGLALAMAISASAQAAFMAGRGLDREMFARAIELESGSAISAADSAVGALAALLKYADELDESREILESLIDDADEGSLPYVLGHLPQLELWTGRWDVAEECAHRQLDLARRTQQESQVQAALFNLAVVAAFRGLVDEALPLATALYEEGRATGALWTERNGAGLLGFLAMSTGDAAAAVRYLGRYDQLGEDMNLREPGYLRFFGDYVEGLVAVGDIERAIELLDRIEPRAVRLQRPSAIGSVRRGRALVLAHQGDADAALATARAAVEAYAGSALVYDRARAGLTLGTVLRRFKLRAEARTVLSEALESFEAMGAASFVERTRLELARVGVRGPAPLALTETESRVASLAAAGRTTRQIADSLFISTKTVEANLTRIYRKLGVANRAELSTVLAANAMEGHETT